jgi:hypothetical protein
MIDLLSFVVFVVVVGIEAKRHDTSTVHSRFKLGQWVILKYVILCYGLRYRHGLDTKILAECTG